MRRRAAIVGLGVLAVVAVLTVMFWPRGPYPCRATFERVRVGMTYDEVCATVGEPPGDYASGPYLNPPCSSWVMFCDRWVCDDAELLVDFEDDGTARFVTVQTHLIPVTQPPFLDRLRDRLGL